MKKKAILLYAEAELKLHNSAIFFHIVLITLGTCVFLTAKSSIVIGIAYPLVTLAGLGLFLAIRERLEILKFPKYLTGHILPELNGIEKLIKQKLFRLKRHIKLDYSSFILGLICLFLGAFVIDSPQFVGVGSSWSLLGALSLIYHLWSEWSTHEIHRKLTS